MNTCIEQYKETTEIFKKISRTTKTGDHKKDNEKIRESTLFSSGESIKNIYMIVSYWFHNTDEGNFYLFQIIIFPDRLFNRSFTPGHAGS